jgi:glycosyltransferase involved in cell wall biosynthesis
MNCQTGFDVIPALRAACPEVVIVVQQHAEEVDRSGYVRYVATRYSPLIDAYSATSHDLKDRICYHGADAAKVRVIYTGIDAEGEWRPSGARPPRHAGDPLRVLYAGRLEDQKDPALMVDVVAAAHRRGIALQVDVVGEGSLREETEARCRAAGVDGAVRFHGVSLAMAPWYDANDVLLMTSRFEGIPYVIFEAMAMGLACVVPDVNANRELVDASVGFVVDDREDVDAYVAALTALASDPMRCAELGAAGRRRVVESFPLTGMAEAHMALYDELLSARRRGRA